jgi:hypothetical protein
VIDRLCGARVEYRTFQERKTGAVYRARKVQCLWIWAVAGFLMLICPGGACLIPLFLAATFLSFAILDGD